MIINFTFFSNDKNSLITFSIPANVYRVPTKIITLSFSLMFNSFCNFDDFSIGLKSWKFTPSGNTSILFFFAPISIA